MIRISTASGLMLILWASLACAEEAPLPPTDGAYERDVQIARNLTEQSRQATVAANLPLTEAQGNAFWPVYLKYREDVTKQNERLARAHQDLFEGIRLDDRCRREGTRRALISTSTSAGSNSKSSI